MWRFQLTRCLMLNIPPWATEMSQEAGTLLNMLGAVCWLYNAQKLFCILPRKFSVHFLDEIYHPGAHFQLFCFSMVIWNDWKWKSSHQEVMHKSGNWTKHYDWSAGLKHECWLAVAQPPPQDEKGTSAACCWCIWCPHACTRSKINNFSFSGGERSDMIMSIAA